MIRWGLLEVFDHLGDDGEGGVDVNSMVLRPCDGEKVSVGVGVMKVSGAKELELGVEGGGHCINLGWWEGVGLEKGQQIPEVCRVKPVVFRVQISGDVVCCVPFSGYIK